MERSFSSSERVVTVDDTDPRDPSARCDRCGSRGTVARAARDGDPPLVLRYCSPCWPAAQEELEARQRDELKRWQETEGASLEMWTSASRSWYDTRRYLALLTQPVKEGPALPSADLATIAADIRAVATEMDGPIPEDVDNFLAMYSRPER
jgi:hypothetical protein